VDAEAHGVLAAARMKVVIWRYLGHFAKLDQPAFLFIYYLPSADFSCLDPWDPFSPLL
jgi:hypothetical protein